MWKSLQVETAREEFKDRKYLEKVGDNVISFLFKDKIYYIIQ